MQFLPLPHGSLRPRSSRFSCRLSFALASVALASVLLASLPLADRASAASVEWADPTGGFFDIGSNWVGGAYPTVNDATFFSLDDSYTVLWDSLTATSTPGVSSLRISDGNVVFQNIQSSTQWDFTIGVGQVFEGASLTIRGLHLQINDATDYRGTLTIDGDNPVGSKMTVSAADGLRLIQYGYLVVQAGGEVASTSGHLGLGGPTAYGVAYVTGLGSQWNNTGNLDVGADVRGYLGVADGGVVTNSEGNIGFSSGSTGVAEVRGAGSQWNNSNSLVVGS